MRKVIITSQLFVLIVNLCRQGGGREQRKRERLCLGNIDEADATTQLIIILLDLM